MAYGKIPLSQTNVVGWRDRSKNQEKENKRLFESRGYTMSRYSNIYKPPVDGTFDDLRIIEGKYKIPRPFKMDNGDIGIKEEEWPWFEVIRHYDGLSKQNSLCSAGPMGMLKGRAQPCIPCISYWNSEKDSSGRRHGRFSRQLTYIFTVLGYGIYAQVPQLTKEGMQKINPKTNQPYTEWVKKVPGLRDITKEKEGHVMHWVLGQEHKDTLMNYDSIINKTCANCGTVDGIHRRALRCANPECGEDVIDCALTAVSEKQQNDMMSNPVPCPHCGNIAPLVPYYECTGCDHLKPASIFDVDIQIGRVVGESSSQLIIPRWSKPHPVDPIYKARPLDLPKMYTPDSIETQEKRFGILLEEAESYNPGLPAAGPYAKEYQR